MVVRAAPIARKVFDAYLLGKMPEGMQPLDSERGTTAIGATAFDNEDAGARQAGDPPRRSWANIRCWSACRRRNRHPHRAAGYAGRRRAAGHATPDPAEPAR
jgi:penicillin-binding protein 2